MLALALVACQLLEISALWLTPPSRNQLFCTAFVLDTGGNFDMVEKQFKKCDDYQFFSTYNDPARKIVQILDKAPLHSHRNFPIAEAMWGHLSKLADKFEWFLKVDSDCFLRPDKMRTSLSKYSSHEAVAVGRPGRNGKIMLVGAAYALSGKMVAQLQTQHLDAAKLASGVWHGEDTVMNSWIPAAGGVIKNAINADNGCTSFSSTDLKEIPETQDIAAMKAGQSYTKHAPKGKVNMELGDICYSAELAAIHPVKVPSHYADLLKNLDP